MKGMVIHMANGMNHQDANVVPAESPGMAGDPQNNMEVYLGSFAAILAQNLGQYVVVEFLVGTNRLEMKEGILYSSGSNFLSLYDPIDNRYIVCDLYAVKFVTFYNTTTVPPSRMRRISQTPGDNYPAANDVSQMNQNNMNSYPQNMPMGMNGMRVGLRNQF